MSPEVNAEIGAADQQYSRLWAENTARILEQLHGSAFVATAQPAGEAAPGSAGGAADAGEKLWINFKVSGKLAGDQAFSFSPADGVRLSQMLMSETVDGAVPLGEGHTDALNELFRQFAGVVAAACKAKYGGAVEFQLESALAPTWQPASSASWIFAAPQIAPLQWKLLTSAELHAALLAAEPKAAQEPTNAAGPGPTSQAGETAASETAQAPLAAQLLDPTRPAAQVAASAAPVPPASAPSLSAASPPPAPAAAAKETAAAVVNGDTSNLDLLLDVELDASLRFGEREMLLREILELRPGSVVELNRQLQEPAELLVGGRIIARGEVVIVDGNYGLRITDIVQPQKRLESLHT
jgi:flagellar motor switch protein FliN/FliY